MKFAQLIGGEWVEASDGGWWDLVDPGRGEVVDRVPFGGAEDARRAIDAAAEALYTWADTNPYERADILHRAADLLVERADEYAVVTTEESGKPLAQSRAEWLSAPNYLRFAAEEAKRAGGRLIPARARGRRIDVTYRPVGVVGVITAWNFPVYNPNRATSSALAAGCTVVIRPSEYTPRSAMLYAAALVDAGVPPGVVNVINGRPLEMADVMMADPRVRKVAFTGSVETGKSLLAKASQTVTRLSLELGGNAPVIVLDDVDPEEVAAGGVVAKNRNGGQVCIAPQRFYVHASLAEEFTRAAAAANEKERLGHGLAPDTTVGPLINHDQLERVTRIVDQTVDAGATVVTGGRREESPGFFYRPTVLTDVPPDAPACTEEIFGPVMPVIPFDDVDAAVEWANSTEHGLAAFVWTHRLEQAHRISERLEYGLVGINDWYPVTPEAPFGGFKQSGIGRESGMEGLYEYLEVKTRYWGGIR
ncbi:MAG: NAD-dependent succinate-semialdehyde dehydrogenase [Acidimicrobiia bacterium]|nr:MAG: NAD-dependent succinate-semialdehyde dehydrogenase [Acidimicrobiia bacterium]